MMNNHEYQIHVGDGVKLFCQSWQPSSSAVAVIFIVHGLGEHSGRYEEFAEKCILKGIAVFSYDHRGHGRSDGKRGYARSAEQLIEDAEFALMKCRSLFLDIPIFILGHSMGGQIAASFMKKIKSRELSGGILSSAWLQLVSPPPAWQISMARMIKKLFPSLTLANGLEPNQITSVQEEADAYQRDPLGHDKISLALFTSIHKNGQKLLDEHKLAKVPVLVCHGDSDTITDHEASREYAKNLGIKASFRSLPGSLHEPHHDKNKDEVMDYYVTWVLEQIT